jgi:shikimate kinase
VGNITLIGFMGTGKTEVGRLVAQRLGMEFVDCDALIEKQTGLTVPEIFERSGEPRFRELERRASPAFPADGARSWRRAGERRRILTTWRR